MSVRRDPTQRFSARVEDYRRYRPDYPAGLLPLLLDAGTLRDGDVVADVGCGTGQLARPFLKRGHTVIAVEPNRPMREAAARQLGGYQGFRSVDGRAERTGLPATSVDLVVVGQAFHWFDKAAARHELAWILRPPRRAALVWNERREDSSALMSEYERLLRVHGTDYGEVKRDWIDEDEIARFFGDGAFRHDLLPHEQRLDRRGFLGRVLSSSYLPAEGQPGHAALRAEFEALFDAEQRGGEVVLDYRTRIFHGRMGSGG